MNKLIRSACIATALSMPLSGHADWSIIGLGPLFGAYSNATAINDSGQVVGWGAPQYGYLNRHALITGPNGVGKTDLGTLGGIESFAYDINNGGQVVGYSDMDMNGDINHAFITGPNGIGITDLGTFGGQSSSAQAINNSAQVVVTSTIPNGGTGQQSLFLTGQNGIGMKDLGLSGIIGAFWPETFGINDSGQVAGSFFADAFFTGPNGEGINKIDLSSSFLPTWYQPSFILGNATDINDSGQVIGFGTPDSNIRLIYGFITDSTGMNVTNLGNFIPVSINDSGEAVGGSKIFSHGGITDLALLAPIIENGWTELFLNDINNHGQMVGVGKHNGEYEAFLISYTSDTVFHPGPIVVPSIPEPQTYALLLVGLGLLGFMIRRKKQNIYYSKLF